MTDPKRDSGVDAYRTPGRIAEDIPLPPFRLRIPKIPKIRLPSMPGWTSPLAGLISTIMLGGVIVDACQHATDHIPIYFCAGLSDGILAFMFMILILVKSHALE